MQDIEACSASVIGSEHIRVGKNNQDSYAVTNLNGHMAAVVCDGCGSGKQSEIGAFLGARIIGRVITDDAYHGLDMTKASTWEDIHRQATSRMYELSCNALVRLTNHQQLIEEAFLFTVVGIYIGPKWVIPFHIGDGVLRLNGVIYPLGPFANNAPPYMGYGLLRKNGGWTSEAIAFSRPEIIERSHFSDALVGSDGLLDLAKALGPDEGLDQFYRNDKYFKNPDAARRKLAVLNQVREHIDYERRVIVKSHPQLPDDTTLIAIRRKA